MGGNMICGGVRAVLEGIGTGMAVKDLISAMRVSPVKPESIILLPIASTSPPNIATSETVASSHANPHNDGKEWKPSGGSGEESGIKFSAPFNFGPVPSEEEVKEAISTLEQLCVPATLSQVFVDGVPSVDKNAIDKIPPSTELIEEISSGEPKLDCIKPAQQLPCSEPTQAQGQRRIYDAFRLLQSNPIVQGMVVSLSSDKAVWDSVMKNESVQGLQKSLNAESRKPHNSDESPDIATKILRWILENARATVMDFISKIGILVNELFLRKDSEFLKGKVCEKHTDSFADILWSSFMLSVMVFIVVVVKRLE